MLKAYFSGKTTVSSESASIARESSVRDVALDKFARSLLASRGQRDCRNWFDSEARREEVRASILFARTAGDGGRGTRFARNCTREGVVVEEL